MQILIIDKRTLALFISVEERYRRYRFTPAVTINKAVLGGILPKFSAIISISWKLCSRSILIYAVVGLAVNLSCEIIIFLFTNTEIVSSSMSRPEIG